MALLLKRNVPCRLFRRLTLGGILTPLGFVLASAFGMGPILATSHALCLLSVQQFAFVP